MKQNRKHLNSVEKALEILLAFQEDRPSWGVRELGTHLGMSPATAQRILQSLKAYGFVDQHIQTRQYQLGNVFYRFLHTLQSTYPITRAGALIMERLLRNSQETVHLNVIEGMQRVCIDNLESAKNLKASMPIGSRSPLYAGASSKCLLAFSAPEFIEDYLAQTRFENLTGQTITDRSRLLAELADIQEKGYAMSLGERSPGLGSISAPVRDHRGRLLASISLAIPEIRYTDEHHRQYCLEALRQAAAEFSRIMGYRTPD